MAIRKQETKKKQPNPNPNRNEIDLTTIDATRFLGIVSYCRVPLTDEAYAVIRNDKFN